MSPFSFIINDYEDDDDDKEEEKIIDYSENIAGGLEKKNQILSYEFECDLFQFLKKKTRIFWHGNRTQADMLN